MDFTPSITVESLKWERVVLNIAGKINNINPDAVEFHIANGERSQLIKSAEIKDGFYLIRLNVTTADAGCTFLEGGNWSITARDKVTGSTYPIEISDNLFCDDAIEDEYVYCNDKRIKMGRFAKLFAKSTTHYYNVLPLMDDKGNLYISIDYQPPVKKNPIVKFFKGIIKPFKPMVYATKRGLFRALFYIANAFPHSGNVILFTSDSRAELSGNMELVYKRMCERGLDKQFKIKMMFRESVKTYRSFTDKFKMPFILGRSDIIIVDDYNPTIELVKYRPHVKIIQLWHACGAFKTVGFSRLGKVGGPAVASSVHRHYTHAIASSDHVARFYAEAFGIDEARVYPTGVPRTDIFFDPEYKVAIREKMKRVFPIINGKKVILFAPTFRGNGAKSANYPFGKINMHALADYCRKTDSVVIFKMHPFVTTPIFIPKEFSDIMIDETESREINDFLFVTDLLITDYSSVIYEASTLNIPMLFYAFDLESYIASRDFYEPFETFVPGKIVKTSGEMMKALETGDFEHEKVAPFRDRNFEYQDGGSTDRVIDWLILGAHDQNNAN